jgi:hypothetical protein
VLGLSSVVAVQATAYNEQPRPQDDVMRSYFPRIRDGWYIPSGGHFYYGIQAGKTIGDRLDLTLRAGATNAQHNDEQAVVPYYLQLGLGIRF